MRLCTTRFARWGGLFAGLAVAACAADPEGSGRGGGAAGVGVSGAGSAGATQAGMSGAGDGSFGNPTQGIVDPGLGMMMLPIATPDGGECGATSMQAEQVTVTEEIEVMEEVTSRSPVAIFLMLDQSGSMIFLWPGAVNAINAFVSAPESAGIDVAIQYFPIAAGATCDGTGYATPEVMPGRLPAHATAISNSLGLHAPFGSGTPIEGALRGATQFCAGFQATNPDEKCVAVLITDGAPSGCNHDFAALAQIAGDANTTSEVLTYAVGLAGSDFNLLDQIAMSGGAIDCNTGAPTFACDVTAGSMLLVDALNQIRDTVTTIETRIETVTMIVETPLPCEWQLPASTGAGTFDRDKVNVQLSSASASTVQLGNVPSEAQCAANGWRYDDPAAPARIIACPETCELIQSTAQAKVDILLGCETVVLE